MKITEIRTGEVRGHGYSCYVRIYTDAGITGTGECIHGGAGHPGDHRLPRLAHPRRGPHERGPAV